MSDPFLILHKVRGEPAFDIAIKLQIGDEEGWIIPTSGHRAYPFAIWEVGKLVPMGVLSRMSGAPPMPTDWPDHYPCNASPKEVTTTASVADLLVQLGLATPINRRA